MKHKVEYDDGKEIIVIDDSSDEEVNVPIKAWFLSFLESGEAYKNSDLK